MKAPTVSAPVFENAPARMREYPNWVLWRYVWKADKQKWDKPLFRVDKPLVNAASTKPDTWATFDEAVAAYTPERDGGIGFVFTDTPFTGVDLDHVRDAEIGVIVNEAKEIVKDFTTYSEVSPSRTGMHMVLEGAMPGKGRKVSVGGWDIEAYSTGRYFTFTGDRISKQADVQPRQPQLDALLARYFKPNGNGNGSGDGTRRVLPPVDASDDELVEMMLRRHEGFAALWRGDFSAYPSQSNADAALLTHLAWMTGEDRERMDVLFRQSGLMRDKWERDTYRNPTLDHAVACNGGKSYSGGKSEKAAPSSGSAADASGAAEAAQTSESASDEPPEIASSPDILSDFNMVLHGRGVVGEDRFGKVVYLCLTSRVLERPVSLAAKGQSSAGKSFVVQEVLKFFPASAYYAMTGMSERVLAYSKEPLQHRFLIVYEAAGMEGDFASYLIRSLLSEGCIRYETMLRVKGKGIVPVLITREGPTGLITTTTKVHLHPENETRLLSVPANDTQEQTAAVMRMLACETGAVCDDDLTEWHALQSWIAAQDNRVTIPYAYQLADLVPPVAVRLRRDFSTVRDLVKAHAILHQQTRERDAEGRIVATLGDYAVVRSLIADLVADEVGATVPPLVVETVNAVAELKATHAAGVTYTQLGAYLKVDKSTAMRRARVAMDRGYLQNLEDKRGRPALLTTADPLPSDVDILPTIETLGGCVVAYALNPEREKC